MNRDEIKDAIIALGTAAGNSHEYNIASVLMFVASAVASGDERTLAELLSVRFEARQRVKR